MEPNLTLKQGDVVLATYGWNDVLQKPFQFLYEFGYYTENGCVVYIQGERNMQDSYAFSLDKISLAGPSDFSEHIWGS